METSEDVVEICVLRTRTADASYKIVNGTMHFPGRSAKSQVSTVKN